jgi:transketolase
MAEKDQKLPRDVFIDEILEEALRNDKIYFLTADLGAKALDRVREIRKNQFLHVGISEQNMIDVAAGLAQNGKIVYAYAMAPFITMRCFEQIKVAIASMSLPLAIIGNGVGFSYDDAGPTHYATEDISCMRGLADIEIVTPSDTISVRETARISYQKPMLRYVRLDRAFLPEVYADSDRRFLHDGFTEIDAGEKLCILTSGYMVQKAREVRAKLEKEGHQVAVIDVYRIKPLDGEKLKTALNNYSKIVTLEEHFLSGGMGGAIVETLADAGISKQILRIGIRDHYYCENGGRNYLHRLAGIDVETIFSKITKFIAQS